jgi:hypothetical protein
LIAVAICSGCKALPPPPVLAPHATTAAEPLGSTTVLLVFGVAGEILGGDGLGVAVRMEHQQTDATAYGVELTGGAGDDYDREDGAVFQQWMIGVRGYGRFTPSGQDKRAYTFGAGLSRTATGMITGSLHGGVELSYVNAYAEPLSAIGVAGVLPLYGGETYYDKTLDVNFGQRELDLRHPVVRTPLRSHGDIVFALDTGLVVPLGDTGNRISLDLGVAYALFTDDVLFALSAADGQRFGGSGATTARQPAASP